MRWWLTFALAVVCLPPAARADDPKKPAPPAAGKTFQVPFRLTDTKHVLVRVKINGKGPYNLILDTGAPALFLATAICTKLGITADGQNWGTFDRVELEGGVVLEKFRGRVEDPFQLEGMNGLGLAGVTLHGIIGYTVLARYRIELDFTKDKMTWTRLDFEPPAPLGLGGKGGAPGGLDAVGGLMKMMGSLLGLGKRPDPKPRGFLGVELRHDDGTVAVAAVLGDGPAAAAGLKPGDRLTHVAGKAVASLDEVRKLAARVLAGEDVDVKVSRGGATKTLRIKAGEGL